jgi:hypothetical protein
LENIFHEMKSSFASIAALALALVVTGAASQGTAQVGTGETVIQKATAQFESSTLKTTSLSQGLQLQTCAHGRRNGYLYRSGERRSGRGQVLESVLSQH